MSARAAAALAVMRAHGSAGAGARVTALEQLEGGWSRHSHAMTVVEGGEERQFIVRVRPRGALLDSDLEQEYRTYERLAGAPVPTPAVHGLDGAADTAFGGPFFVMDLVPGRSPNVWRRRDRALLEEDWGQRRRIAADLVETLAAVHALDPADFGGVVQARSYREAVGHWQGVQEEMRLVRDPVVEEAYAWLADREPAPVPPRLVHGDYRIGNCLLDGGRISGVLDWELAYLGDPRFDLGYLALAYHAGKFVNPGSPLLNAVADADWFFDRYTALTGDPVDRAAVRTFSALGALMLIAILTTGIRMFATEQTSDIRMLWTRFAIPGLRQDLTALMGW